MKNKKIVEFLLKSGIKPNLKGFKLLYTAIEITINNGCKLPKVTKVIYPLVAKQYNDTPSNIERAIRHSIEVSGEEHKCKTCSEFIAFASIKISLGE